MQCLASDQRRFFKLPERLVGVGLRCWLAGYETSDIQCWETGWRIYADRLGETRAKYLVAELAAWARALNTASARRIGYYPFFHPFDCIEFSHDECIAILMIAAAQKGAAALVADCAYSLTMHDDRSAVESASRTFAEALGDAGIRLNQRAFQLQEWPEKGRRANA